ncbi:uncharacterized protein LOC119572276 isoform X1 [Penaeus monodon]|uniref:uncharacterized protein LOC119572276 isoform X1 n=2 Tax=Penaeus monodon TaxID=6687 RepID=UPI0018A70C2D|nr:uncharacterized protein LOC119572276 isoform X1 [Penaeus monodon]XP_037775215.1 uncharacterized protein LOC119572276 isoform X1 [Penaeus monodon]
MESLADAPQNVFSIANMKQLSLLLMLTTIVITEAEAMNKCQDLFKSVENVNTARYREYCIEKYNLPMTVGEGADDNVFIRGYWRLNADQKKALTLCVFREEGFLTADNQFSATAVKAQVTEGLRRVEKSPERDAVTTAISTDACRLQDGDPNLMDTLKFMICLKAACSTAVTSPSDVELLPL